MRPSKNLHPLRTACLFTLVILATATASSAATPSEAAPRWQRASPDGGWIRALAQAPSAPRLLYAAAVQNGHIFRSLDGGATWHRRGRWTGDYAIADLIVAPWDEQTVYALTDYPTLHRSRDGGRTWTQIGPGSDPQVVSALALDRSHPGVLFAATRNGFYRSDDDGGSWTLAALDGSFVSGVAIDPHATDTVFAVIDGTFNEEPMTFWKSTDRGATWTEATLPVTLGYSGVPRFVFHPVQPGVSYIFFTGEFSSLLPVLRSTDGGATWAEIPAPLVIRDFAVLPEGVLLAATELGLWRSVDGGATWVPPLSTVDFTGGPPYDNLRQLLVSSAAPGELFATGVTGIWRSGDNGAHWALSNRGIQAQGAAEVDVAPAGPPSVFAVAGISLFRSPDRGETWTHLHTSIEGPQPYEIEAFDPRHPRTIWGIDWDGQSGYPVVSTNGGRRWSKRQIPFNCDSGGSVCETRVRSLVLDDEGAVLIAGWYHFHFQGTGTFLLRSEDGGQTWEELTPLPDIRDFVLDPRRRNTYYGLSCEGLFRSQDAGARWKKTGRGLPESLCTPDLGAPVLTIDPRDPRRFYVGTMNQGVFASSDGGATFRPMNRGLATAPVVTLLIDPTDSTKLYAGVPLRGVFQWNAEQRRWTPLSRGLPLAQFAGAIALDPRNPSLLYAASPVAGVFRLDLEDSAP